MWEHRRLTTLRASTACYSNSLTISFLYIHIGLLTSWRIRSYVLRNKAGHDIGWGYHTGPDKGTAQHTHFTVGQCETWLQFFQLECKSDATSTRGEEVNQNPTNLGFGGGRGQEILYAEQYMTI
jgi:hypothetical protein